MNVEIKINTKQKVNVGKLESALKDMPKDELREVSKALEDLNDTIQKVIDTTVFKKGDYVRSKSNPSIYGVIAKYPYLSDSSVLISRLNNHIVNLNTSDLEKWTPRKGELCIFWDRNCKFAHIRIFKQKDYSGNIDSVGIRWDNCVPFINDAQFKELVGYDSQS